MTSDDMYSLEHWLRDRALEAHKKAVRYSYGVANFPLQKYFNGKEEMANETIAYIQSRRVSQRPHIRITEEFDGSR